MDAGNQDIVGCPTAAWSLITIAAAEGCADDRGDHTVVGEDASFLEALAQAEAKGSGMTSSSRVCSITGSN